MKIFRRSADAALKEAPNQALDYQARLEMEHEAYRDCAKVHDLPDIFHYWSNRYVRPKLEAFGFSSPDALFDNYLEAQCRRDLNRLNTFVSIGSGNCDLEVGLASRLREKGVTNFRIECLDFNPAMLKRGGIMAANANVTALVTFNEGDFNRWVPTTEYDGVMANQALHHVVNLEGLFSEVHRSLKPDGLFVTSDMIGHNGHQRWPEALAIVEEYWRMLPGLYKYNHQLKRRFPSFENWDCSTEGFEGIRAQDILPLLVDRFHFSLFIGFANVIDPFVDRGFGHNFMVTEEWDRSFIDRIHERDEQEMRAGKIKPTHMLAVMSKNARGAMSFHEPFTPEFCIRRV